MKAASKAYRCMAIDTADPKNEKVLVDVQTVLADSEDSAKTEFIIDNADALKGKEVEILVRPFRCERL